MSADTIMELIAGLAIIILLSLWINIRSQKNDLTDEESKVSAYSEKQE